MSSLECSSLVIWGSGGGGRGEKISYGRRQEFARTRSCFLLEGLKLQFSLFIPAKVSRSARDQPQENKYTNELISLSPLPLSRIVVPIIHPGLAAQIESVAAAASLSREGRRRKEAESAASGAVINDPLMHFIQEH